MDYVNSRWVWRGEWFGKRKGRGKRKRKKIDGLKDETGHRKWGSPCQYIYGNAIENRVMETENN